MDNEQLCGKDRRQLLGFSEQGIQPRGKGDGDRNGLEGKRGPAF